jgi:uncharacterized protein (TIGR03032 family)
MNPQTAAFTCTYSPNMPELLTRLNCSLAISTYQAGKIVFISATSNDRLVQLPRTFPKPMGIATGDSRLAVATLSEVVVFNNASRMAPNYPKRPGTYDALFLPRATYYTGEIDIHDLHWCGDRLLAVNTRFSCLAWIDHQYSFTPFWKPYFISDLAPGDRCHLNGVAFENDEPRFVTALGSTDTPEGWRSNRLKGGVVVETSTNSLVATELAMPHSPRLYDGKLWVLESATGRLLCIDPRNGKKDVVLSLNGFVRGMDRFGDFVFIGLSKIRRNSDSFKDLPVSSKSLFSGVVVVHLPTTKVIGHLQYTDSVEEIYDVRVMPAMRRPTILNHLNDDHRIAVTTPDADYWAVINSDHDNADRYS